MLVLSRKQNQEILIGDNVKITVLKIKGNTVRLGIEAPRNINVIRGELPRHDQYGVATDKPDMPQIAEFTVVFNNSEERSHEKAEVVSFRSNQGVRSGAKEIDTSAQTYRVPDQSRGGQLESHPSVQYRGALPAPLQHNRLKEIVNKLTSNTENSNV